MPPIWAGAQTAADICRDPSRHCLPRHLARTPLASPIRACPRRHRQMLARCCHNGSHNNGKRLAMPAGQTSPQRPPRQPANTPRQLLPAGKLAPTPVPRRPQVLLPDGATTTPCPTTGMRHHPSRHP
jgi:hypothetical protein